jgi:hypothetical protein
MGNHSISGRGCADWLDDGPLAPYIDAFKQYLTDRGYARNSFANCVGSIAHFAQWVHRRRVDVQRVNDRVARHKDTTFRNAKPRKKPFKLSDGGGLYLLVQPNAAKLWRLAYRFDGRQKLLALGVYPATSLAEARTKRDAAKKYLAEGRDPSVVRKSERRAAKLYMEMTKEKKLTEDDVTAIISAPGFDFTKVPKKTFTFAEFLHRIGTLKSKPESWKDLYFAEAHGLAGD